MENKKRLIDADEARRRIVAFATGLHSNVLSVDTVMMLLTQIPIVDAVEVVHGEWGEIFTCHGERLWGYRCSQCEADNSKKSNYCPNCGAKMDKEES